MSKYRNFKNKKWNKENIREMLLKNDNAVKRAIVAIYDRQEEDEKLGSITLHHNNVGFGSYDVKFLSSIAKDIKKDKYINESDMYMAKSRILKYSGQLAEIANENEERKQKTFDEEAKRMDEEIQEQLRLQI